MSSTNQSDSSDDDLQELPGGYLRGGHERARSSDSDSYDDEPFRPVLDTRRSMYGSERLSTESNEMECYSPAKALRGDSSDFSGSEVYSPTKGLRMSDDYRESSYNNSLPNLSDSNWQHDSESHSQKRKMEDTNEKRKQFKYSAYSEGTSLHKPISGGIGAAIMEKTMGYKAGTGLGKQSQGRVAPIELSNQRGRRGLGLSLPNLSDSSIKWDPDSEVIEVRESVDWLDGSHHRSLTSKELDLWMETGPKDHDISKMTEFCSPEVLNSVLSCKTVFDSLSSEELNKSRTRSNPFELIKNGIFLNRAAMKMANMDSAYNFMFTNPIDLDGVPIVGNDKLLYFADVCAGPGGFSEYVLWKKGWRAKGFGFTLVGDCDFKLENFYAGHPETFETYYGSQGDGDVFNPVNINDLKELVMESTNDEGVHFMMADGGFSVEGQENIQEILSKQLYLCQFLVSLLIVRTGGHFVCKLFDLFSPFSVGLVYLMYRAYQTVSIFKPNTSRPANSERYIVCRSKRSDCQAIAEYMYDMNIRLNHYKKKKVDEDIIHCVPLDILKDDQKFFCYIYDSNNSLGTRQICNLAKIAAFAADPELHETRQMDLKAKCLHAWGVPDKMRKADRTFPDDELFKKIVPHSERDFLNKTPVMLEPKNMEEVFGVSLLDWECVLLPDYNTFGFYMSGGRDKISKWDSNKSRWVMDRNLGFELSPGTLLLGEPVTEYKHDPKSSRGYHNIHAFHIYDAYSLGNENISRRTFSSRLEMCETFVKAHQKRRKPGAVPLRVIRAMPLEDIGHIFECVKPTIIHSENRLLVYIDDFSFRLRGILFVKSVKEPWHRHKSRSTGYPYYNCHGKSSMYEKDRPEESVSTFSDCRARQIVWNWEAGVGFLNESPKDGVVHKNGLLNFVHQTLKR